MAAAPGAREIGDRRQAIREAVATLAPGDTLIVAGKGHEEGQHRHRNVSVLGPRRGAQGDRGAGRMTALWETQALVAATGGRPLGKLPETIGGI